MVTAKQKREFLPGLRVATVKPSPARRHDSDAYHRSSQERAAQSLDARG
jgi:hypothetical protein